MTSASQNRQAEWVTIGGNNYDFNPATQTQSEARARCIRLGGKLFEPQNPETNRDVFVQAGAKLPGNTNLWIGVSDIGDEDNFSYLSSGIRVNFVCESSNLGAVGCWETAPAAGGAPTVNCVTGKAADDGKWTNQVCTTTHGSICESPGETPPPPPPASGSTCLESGTAVLLGMLFFCSV
jgi:hypothetical protein